MKDLSAFLTPNLDLKHGSKVYSVPPPSKETGLVLAAINSIGLSAVAGKTYEDAPESQRAIIEKYKDTDLGELSLGPVYQQMIDDGVPGPHIDLYAQYALYYWVLGEDAADNIMEALAEQRGQSAGPKGRSRSKNGRSTGSVKSSGTAKAASRSTRTTGSRTS